MPATALLNKYLTFAILIVVPGGRIVSAPKIHRFVEEILVSVVRR